MWKYAIHIPIAQESKFSALSALHSWPRRFDLGNASPKRTAWRDDAHENDVQVQLLGNFPKLDLREDLLILLLLMLHQKEVHGVLGDSVQKPSAKGKNLRGDTTCFLLCQSNQKFFQVCFILNYSLTRLQLLRGLLLDPASVTFCSSILPWGLPVRHVVINTMLFQTPCETCSKLPPVICDTISGSNKNLI